MACSLCGCHGGRTSIGAAAKTSIILVAWSCLLICLFENRMKAEVAALQEHHVKQVEELTRRHVADIVSSHVADLHVAPQPYQAGLSAVSNVEGSSADAVAGSGATADAPAADDLDRGVPEGRPAGVGLRGSSIEAGELGAAVALGPSEGIARRLPGFYSIGTTAVGTGCFTFAGANTEAIMNSASCRGASNRLCTGCFIATDDTNDKVLEVIACSTAYYKVGSQISSTSHVFMLEIINADPTNTLTVKGCTNQACSPAVTTYVISASDSAVGYCYAGGSNAIFFQTSGIQNANTFDFTGKTISNLGTVTTADINGGTIDGAAIAGGSIDISGGTLTLAAGQIAASKITAGTFVASQTYSFGGSTIADLGTVQDSNIDGGTIDGATIAASDVTVGSGKTLDVSAGTITLAAGQIAADRIKAGTFKAGTTYSFLGSTIASLGTVTTADINGGTIDAVTIAASDVTVGSGKTLDVASGTITLNAGQIPATAIKAGTFKSGATYSFLGSTIASLGTVTTADINGGTIDAVTIAGAVGTFSTLATSAAGTFSLANKGAGSASGNAVTLNDQQGVITSSSNNLAAGSTNTIALTNSVIAATTSIILASAGSCTGGKVGVIGVSAASGSGSIIVMNHGTSACSSTFKVYFAVLP